MGSVEAAGFGRQVERSTRLSDKVAESMLETILTRGLRPGAMFADMELLGIPHRVVVSERGVAAGTLEYRARDEAEARQLTADDLLALLG